MTSAATGADKNLVILVGVDGSPASNAAVVWAARDAEMKHLPLTVAHVVNSDVATWPPMPFPETWAVWQEDEGRKFVAEAVKIAEEAVLTDRKLTIKTELVHSTPVSAMIEMSKDAAILVLGSAGRLSLIHI